MDSDDHAAVTVYVIKRPPQPSRKSPEVDDRELAEWQVYIWNNASASDLPTVLEADCLRI